MSNWTEAHLEVVATMVSEPVAGGRHVQRQTLKGWCTGHGGKTLDSAIDDLITIGLIREKGRDTVTLRSVQDGKDFLQKFDDDDKYTWYY